jgi:tetratricopeptide (TPR) repeat protein
MAKTPLEGNLLHAIEILYDEEIGTKQERDKAYSDYLGELREVHPKQQEIAAFHALSVLGAVPVGRDVEAYEKSARIAAGIMEENPQHPGALHYMIHAYDDPAHAPKAIAAANSYAKVAPAAAHALHMPSHIYVSMGMWDEVISSNIASWDASVARMERMELNDNARSYHALHWLLYGLSQQGRYAEAQQLINDLSVYTQNDPNKGARSYMVTVAANYQVETADWNNAKIQTMNEVDIEDHNVLLKAIRHYTNGYRAFLAEDAKRLGTIIATMQQERKDAANQVTASGAPMCSAAGSSRSLPNQMDIDQAQVLSLELEALHAMLRNDNELAEQHMKAAVALEQATSYSYGPPRIVQPSYEFYGQWLLTQQRPEEAIQQFEYALSKGPKRLHALYGAWQAASMMNDNDKTEKFAAILRESLRHADAEVKKRFSYSSFDMAS